MDLDLKVVDAAGNLVASSVAHDDMVEAVEVYVIELSPLHMYLQKQ